MKAEKILDDKKLDQIYNGHHDILMEVISDLVTQYTSKAFEEGYEAGLKDGKLQGYEAGVVDGENWSIGL